MKYTHIHLTKNRHFGKTALIIASIWLGYFYINIYFSREIYQLIREEMEDAITESIRDDEEIRGKVLMGPIHIAKVTPDHPDHMVVMTERDTTYSPKPKKDLSLEEKLLKAKQTVLYDKNPLVISKLDSIFKDKLEEKRIKATINIWVRDNLKETDQYSGPLNGFNKILPEEPIVLGARNELSIQVYYAVPFSYILSRTPSSYWFALIASLLITVSLSYPYWKRWKQIRKAKREQTYFYPDANCKELLPDLFYHPVNQQLIYKENLFTFSGQSRKLLQAFISNPEQFLSIPDLKQNAWDAIVTDDAVRIAISRFKKELEEIPTIRIVNLPGTGYRMEFIHLPEEV